MLGHVFFGDEINRSLIELLRANNEIEAIEKYYNFIEEMWAKGTDDVINIVKVTILEMLSDEKDIWQPFGTYISRAFKEYINEHVLNENGMMFSVPRL